MERYLYIILASNPEAWDIDSTADPWIKKATALTRDEAIANCGPFDLVTIYKQRQEVGRDEFGKYTNWDTYEAAHIDYEELISGTPIDEFMEPWD